MTAPRARRARLVLGLAAGALLVAGVIALTSGGGPAHPGSFAWLRPAAAPSGWRVASTAGGASFGYPPGWRAVASDSGTASVALFDAGGKLVGYLNATPRQGAETPAGWARFRPDHNREEGDRNVRLLAAAEHLKFRSGSGSCVIDTYSTARAAYREIACLVSGARTTVFVAAAPVAAWPAQAATLERALSTAHS